MRTVTLRDTILPKHRWQTFKSLVDEMEAEIDPGQVQDNGTEAVGIVGCRISYDPSTHIKQRDKRLSPNADEHWAKILRLCREQGFEPM
jgi:hypothetical protein